MVDCSGSSECSGGKHGDSDLLALLILLKDRFRSGEDIKLSDGTKGKVMNID